MKVIVTRKSSNSNLQMFSKMLLLIFVISYISPPAVALTIHTQPDSSKVYREIEGFSKKSMFTRFLYGLIFKPVASITSIKNRRMPLQKAYNNYNAKIIRNINIVTLDPFGYSLNDTAVLSQKTLTTIGNNLHIKTQHITIKNIILFRENDRFDLFLVKESERLIRSLNYVREAVFLFVPVEKADDSVDVYIRIMDKWSILPYGNPLPAHSMVGITENNFIGFGHEFKNKYSWNSSSGQKAYATNYYIPNVRNSHISSILHLNIDEKKYFNRSIAVERPFFSPAARWAAGLNIAQNFQKDMILDSVQGSKRQNFKSNTQDYWAGHASKTFNKNIENEHITNAIVALRYLRIRYSEKPDALHDPLHIYSNEDFYLSGIGIVQQNYLKDKYLFNFGGIEYVPVGKAYGITGGYQIRNNTGRFYLGAHISLGDYFKLGNLSGTFEYGTFINRMSAQQGVISASARYFSNLLEIGNWKIRQFIKPQLTIGINRFSYENLTINDENGIQGFNSSLQGTKKIILTQQVQSYAPWKVLGFRFGPFLIFSFGILGDVPAGFKNSTVYSQVGTGALINNEYLVNSNFQLSLSYYPSIPDNGYNIFKFNSFITTDFGFRDFSFGKPEITTFQ